MERATGLGLDLSVHGVLLGVVGGRRAGYNSALARQQALAVQVQLLGLHEAPLDPAPARQRGTSAGQGEVR